ncbi:F-actin-capping protein subunit beta [Favolaschia claudopus]|uniref:F-actin-capping protein subunit beta n=1 Tax=Favolaschia claudopus TaxID=2862362 RepID=A0AAW0C356_9AGAR
MLSRRQLVITGCLVFLPFLIWQLVTLNERFTFSTSSFKLWPSSSCSGSPATSPQADKLASPLIRRRVAVASNFGFHFDVYMSVVWTLERIFDRNPAGGVVEVFAPSEFGFEFQQIVDRLGLYHGENRNANDLIEAINSNQGDGGIDLVVLGTCEVDLRFGTWAEELLAAWDARDRAHKFQLVCIVHNVKDDAWHPRITEWAQRGAIRLLPISQHVAAAFKRSFLISADSSNATIRSADYESIPVDVHVPVLDIPLSAVPRPARILSDAVIQGSFSTDRRDYIEIFEELKESLARDPKTWGYTPLVEDSQEPVYVVDTTLPDPPFRLLLVGSGWLQVPHELKNIVIIRDGLGYPDFYELMSSMDICVPAFSVKDHGYYEDQASSTFAMAVECNVPILVTERMRKTYTYVDDERAVVTRPAAMREIEALRALRSGDASYFLHRTGISMESSTALAAASMLRNGWLYSMLDLMRRLPPTRTEENVSALIRICPEYADDLLGSVDQPLKVRTDRATGKDYLACDYNRDGESFRSPWSNEYDPPLDDGTIPTPKLRKLEIAANEAFDTYREMYFEGGASSVYLWDLDDGGFAGVVLLKKVMNPTTAFEPSGSWDSIHVFEAAERGRGAHYKLTSTVMLHLVTRHNSDSETDAEKGNGSGNKNGGAGWKHEGEVSLSGSMTRQTEQDWPIVDSSSHITNTGRMIEEMEFKMRGLLQEVYFGKTRDIVYDLRSVEDLATERRQRELQKELVGRLGKR